MGEMRQLHILRYVVGVFTIQNALFSQTAFSCSINYRTTPFSPAKI